MRGHDEGCGYRRPALEHSSRVRARVVEPEGRPVVLTERAWTHIRSAHPELAPYERTVLETIMHPVERGLDERPGRERYVRRDVGPSRFLTVVVEFADDEGVVVTAFGHRNAR